MRFRALLCLLLAVATAALISACGVSASASRPPKRHGRDRPTAKKVQGRGAGKVQDVAGTAGSGAMLRSTAASQSSSSAGVAPGTAPTDALYGPPATSLASEDVPGGETALVADNGAAKVADEGQKVREQMAKTFSIPSDQRFTSRWFAARSPWNLNIANYPTDPHSAQMLRLAEYRVQVTDHGTKASTTKYVRDNSGLYINTVAWTDPVVQGGPATAVHCRQSTSCGDDLNNEIAKLDIPRTVNPDPYYDGWFTVISPNGKYAYDLWRARRLSDGSISFAYMRIWRLDGPGYGKPNLASARGSGLPLFAGLIRPEELEQGEIDHALAISVPGPASRYYVQPASTTDGSGPLKSLPEGARIRLKANVKIPKDSGLDATQRRYASALLSTLRNYGAIVVDRSAVPTLYAQQGVIASMLVGNELQSLKLSDFQVINLPKEREYTGSQAAGAGADGGGY